VQPLVGGLPRPVALGQVAPRGAGTQLPQGRIDRLAVVPPPAPDAGHGREQGLDPGPGIVGQLSAPHHSGMITETSEDPLTGAPDAKVYLTSDAATRSSPGGEQYPDQGDDHPRGENEDQSWAYTAWAGYSLSAGTGFGWPRVISPRTS
jgi:hypothetical protein